jgi:hypothetical protein
MISLHVDESYGGGLVVAVVVAAALGCTIDGCQHLVRILLARLLHHSSTLFGIYKSALLSQEVRQTFRADLFTYKCELLT